MVMPSAHTLSQNVFNTLLTYGTSKFSTHVLLYRPVANLGVGADDQELWFAITIQHTNRVL
jgi:hypothetical protein